MVAYIPTFLIGGYYNYHLMEEGWRRGEMAVICLVEEAGITRKSFNIFVIGYVSSLVFYACKRVSN